MLEIVIAREMCQRFLPLGVCLSDDGMCPAVQHIRLTFTVANHNVLV